MAFNFILGLGLKKIIIKKDMFNFFIFNFF